MADNAGLTSKYRIRVRITAVVNREIVKKLRIKIFPKYELCHSVENKEFTQSLLKIITIMDLNFHFYNKGRIMIRVN
jgi:hypothetical protein